MGKSRFLAVAFVGGFLLTALFPLCSPHPQKQDFMQTSGKIPSKQLSNYTCDFSSSLSTRAQEIPAFLLEMWRHMDNDPNYKNYPLTQEDRDLLQQYIELLPELNKSILKKRLIAFYVIDGLQGSAATDYVFDKDTTCYYYILLNSKMFTTGISEWLTYRDNSTFIQNDSTVRIQVDCGNKYKALLYALLHESSHVIDYADHVTPYVEEAHADVPKLHAAVNPTPFTQGIWAGYRRLNPSTNFPSHDKITAYGFGHGPKINISNAKNIYTQLALTPVVSLYGSQNWAEDFADFVMAYQLTNKLGQPYKITCFVSGQSVLSIEPMKEKSVVKRIKNIENIYGGPSQP